MWAGVKRMYDEIGCNEPAKLCLDAKAKLGTKDARKVQYAVDQVSENSGPLFPPLDLKEAVRKAIDWEANQSPAMAMQARGRVMQALREANERMRRSGSVRAWMQDVDVHVRKVAEGVNGPLFRQLLERTGYPQPEVADMLRQGIVGTGALGPP